MTCKSTHFSCECQRELLEDTIDALAHTLAGIEKYIASVSPHDRIGIYTKFDLGINSAKSVLRRAKRVK